MSNEREKYEKPDVTTVDLGNLVQEAEARAAELSKRAGALIGEAEAAMHHAHGLQAEAGAIEFELQGLKQKLATLTVILGQPWPDP